MAVSVVARPEPRWRNIDGMGKASVSDTSPAAARVQLELIRNASPERRLEACFGFSRSLITLSRAALREASPGSDELELQLQWVESSYGAHLAAALRAHLSSRR